MTYLIQSRVGTIHTGMHALIRDVLFPVAKTLKSFVDPEIEMELSRKLNSHVYHNLINFIDMFCILEFNLTLPKE
jgi:hypothetical protein